jgi:hypothetical protein
VSTQLELTGLTRTNPKTGKPRYYKDNKATHDKNNARQMYVAGKYISKKHPLHKPGRYKNWDDAHSHKQLDSTTEGHVYAIYNPHWPSWFKIGMAVDAEDRVRSYQTACPFRNYKLVSYVTTTQRRKLEAVAHELFQQNAQERRGEWFKLGKQQVEELMQQLHECNEWK